MRRVRLSCLCNPRIFDGRIRNFLAESICATPRAIRQSYDCGVKIYARHWLRSARRRDSCIGDGIGNDSYMFDQKTRPILRLCSLRLQSESGLHAPIISDPNPTLPYTTQQRNQVLKWCTQPHHLSHTPHTGVYSAV